MRLGRFAPFLTLALTALIALGLTSVASGEALAKLDSKPATPGHIVTNSAGTTFVAWTHQGGTKADYAEVCRIPKGGKCKDPMKLSNPAGTDGTEGVAGAFPLVLGGKDVDVIAPRYVMDDLVLWQSTDGGKTFDDGELIPGYSNKSNPSDVVFTGEAALVSADNPGLGFSESVGSAGAGFTFSGATGTVEGSSLAGDGITQLIESYWTLGSKDKVRYFSWNGSDGDPGAEAAWSGPTDVANGYGGELTSGSNGVFMVTQEYKGKKNPTAVRVRALTDSGFGSPVTLVNDKTTDLFATGDIAEAPNGHVAVVWPGYKKNGDFVMRAFTSNNGKNFSGPSLVAGLGNAYGTEANAQLAYTNGGSGLFTFLNGSGLHLADLKKLK